MLRWLRRFSPLASRTRKKTSSGATSRRTSLRVEVLENRVVPALQVIQCDLSGLAPMVQDDALLFGVADRICDQLPVITLRLDAASDTGTLGDGRTNLGVVDLVGTTRANARVEIVGTGIGAIADAQGNFTLQDVTLNRGFNEFSVIAVDPAGNIGQGMLAVTFNSAPTVSGGIQDVSVMTGAPNTVINLAAAFSDVDIQNTLVRFFTSGGKVDAELFDERTPRHVTNFLNYITSGRYQNTIFHRSARQDNGLPFVLQGGGFRFDDGADNVADDSSLPPVQTDAAVQNEPGISNLRGTIALAKLGGDPSSGTSQFFFNLGNNAANLDNQNGGFTVFGQVIGTGMQVVDNLAALPTQNRQGAFNEIPLVNFPRSEEFPDELQRSNLALIKSVLIRRLHDFMTFSVVNNTNMNLVNASVSNNNLTLSYQTGQTGTAAITIRATDRDGLFVETTFNVTVQ